MSRHDLKPKPDQPHVIKAAVGWDRPLQTYFAQVFFVTDDEPEEDEALIWFGTTPGELLSAEAAIAIVEPHAVVPAALANQLDMEMRNAVGAKDGKCQVAMKRRLFGSFH